MRLIATLLLIGCATTLPEPRPTAPAVPAHAESLEGPQDPEVTRLAAELETSLASPPPAVPEPPPYEPIWHGYMIVKLDSVPPGVVIVFADDGVITRDVLADGVQLNAATASANDGYWRFPITRGAVVSSAVRVYDDGRVVVELSYTNTTLLKAADVLKNSIGADVYALCSANICGRLYKATSRIVGCEGQYCFMLVDP